MSNLVDFKVDKKALIGVSAGAVLILAVIILAWNYPDAPADKAQDINSSPAVQPAVDLAKLSEVYQAQSTKIISDFLSASGNIDNIGTSAKQAQNSLLSLSLPAEFRQKHLAEVLLLGEISDLASSGQSAKISAKINELKQIASQ